MRRPSCYTTMPDGRFVLAIGVLTPLVRAALVLADGRMTSAARQPFQLDAISAGIHTFDPAEVWYKTKRVIAACMDIGRTQAREIAAIALVYSERDAVLWTRFERETYAAGIQRDTGAAAGAAAIQTRAAAFCQTLPSAAQPVELRVGGMDAWMLECLTGRFVTLRQPEGMADLRGNAEYELCVPSPVPKGDVAALGKTAAGVPPGAGIPIACVLPLQEPDQIAQGDAAGDAPLILAGTRAFGVLARAGVTNR